MLRSVLAFPAVAWWIWVCAFVCLYRCTALVLILRLRPCLTIGCVCCKQFWCTQQPPQGSLQGAFTAMCSGSSMQLHFSSCAGRGKGHPRKALAAERIAAEGSGMSTCSFHGLLWAEVTFWSEVSEESVLVRGVRVPLWHKGLVLWPQGRMQTPSQFARRTLQVLPIKQCYVDKA